MVLLLFLILSIIAYFKHLEPTITSMQTVPQVWSSVQVGSDGGQKLKSECHLTNHLHARVFKKKEETKKMPAAKPKSCGNVSFSKIALPVTALVSFPGSGNTWLRHLIQEATGKFSRVLFHDFLKLSINNAPITLVGFKPLF